jgi:hypothetical protein
LTLRRRRERSVTASFLFSFSTRPSSSSTRPLLFPVTDATGRRLTVQITRGASILATS